MLQKVELPALVWQALHGISMTKKLSLRAMTK